MRVEGDLARRGHLLSCHLFHADAVHQLIDLIRELHVLLVEHGQVILLSLVYQGELLQEYALSVLGEVEMSDLSAELPHHEVVGLDITAKVFELLVLPRVLLVVGLRPSLLIVDPVLRVLELRPRELSKLHFLALCYMLHYPFNVV